MRRAKPRFSRLCLVVVVTLLMTGLAQSASQLVTFQFVNTEYKDVFQTLGEIAGLNVLVDKSVTGTGSFSFHDIDLQEALQLVAQASGADYLIKDNTLLVAAAERMAVFQESQLYYVYTKHIAPQKLIPVLAMFMPEDNIYADNENSLLVLYGSSDQLQKARDAVSQLDVPAKRAYHQQETVLTVLKMLTEDLGLDLIADPSLASAAIAVNIRNLDPLAALDLIAEQAGLDLSIANGALVANRKGMDGIDAASRPVERIKIYRLSHADPEAAGRMLQLIVAADRIQVDQGSKSILIRVSEDQIAEVDQFMAEYDQPLPQVLLEVWIHEIADDASKAFGLDWSGNLPGFQVGSTDPDSLFQVELDWEPWQILLALQALEQQGKAKILARPKIATLSGQEARFFVGDRIPIVLTDDDGNQSIEFLESGINLTVLPRISEDGLITIDVRPEVSLFMFVDGTPYPQIRTREAQTTIRVKAGQPVLIGGLIQEQEREHIDKVPFVGDLPIIGRLFRVTDTVTERTEMSIILIPRIIDGSEGFAADSFFPPTR
ncbi:MAG: hypothetical protein WBK87_10570 [Limnochordia bacterium]